MFSRITQIGKNISEEFESVVNSTNRPASSNGSDKSGSNVKRADSGSMASAFQTLKTNAKILNQQTPDPGALEVVFNSNQSSSDNEAAKNLTSGAENPEPPAATESNAENTDLPESNGSTKVPEFVEKPNAEPQDAKKSDEVHTSKEIASKLRKFRKYEEKYPGMYRTSF